MLVSLRLELTAPLGVPKEALFPSGGARGLLPGARRCCARSPCVINIRTP